MFRFFHGVPYAVYIELKNFYLCVLFWRSFVCYVCGDVRGWRGCCWGGDLLKFCVVGRVVTCRLYSVKSVGSECGGWWRGSASGGWTDVGVLGGGWTRESGRVRLKN